MTKAQAEQFRKEYGNYAQRMTYSSKGESMSIRVYTSLIKTYDEETENERVYKFLSRVKDEPYAFSFKRRRYQGLIQDACIIVK